MSNVAYAHVLTMVYDTSDRVLGFAFLDFELAPLPEIANEWDGVSKLSSASFGAKAYEAKKQVANKNRPGTPLSHVSALGASPFSLSHGGLGLGMRIMRLQRHLAHAAMSRGLVGPIFMIEAMKPLDRIYYPKIGFMEALRTWVPVEDTYLQPMCSKLVDSDHAPAAAAVVCLDDLELVAYDHRVDGVVDMFGSEPVDGANRLSAANCSEIISAVRDFLWATKDNGKAAGLLRQICKRAGLANVEATKLWNMRGHTANLSPLPDYPAGMSTWFSEAADASLVHLVLQASVTTKTFTVVTTSSTSGFSPARLASLSPPRCLVPSTVVPSVRSRATMCSSLAMLQAADDDEADGAADDIMDDLPLASSAAAPAPQRCESFNTSPVVGLQYTCPDVPQTILDQVMGEAFAAASECIPGASSLLKTPTAVRLSMPESVARRGGAHVGKDKHAAVKLWNQCVSLVMATVERNVGSAFVPKSWTTGVFKSEPPSASDSAAGSAPIGAYQMAACGLANLLVGLTSSTWQGAAATSSGYLPTTEADSVNLWEIGWAYDTVSDALGDSSADASLLSVVAINVAHPVFIKAKPLSFLHAAVAAVASLCRVSRTALFDLVADVDLSQITGKKRTAAAAPRHAVAAAGNASAATEASVDYWAPTLAASVQVAPPPLARGDVARFDSVARGDSVADADDDADLDLSVYGRAYKLLEPDLHKVDVTPRDAAVRSQKLVEMANRMRAKEFAKPSQRADGGAGKRGGNNRQASSKAVDLLREIEDAGFMGITPSEVWGLMTTTGPGGEPVAYKKFKPDLKRRRANDGVVSAAAVLQSFTAAADTFDL